MSNNINKRYRENKSTMTIDLDSLQLVNPIVELKDFDDMSAYCSFEADIDTGYTYDWGASGKTWGLSTNHTLDGEYVSTINVSGKVYGEIVYDTYRPDNLTEEEIIEKVSEYIEGSSLSLEITIGDDPSQEGIPSHLHKGNITDLGYSSHLHFLEVKDVDLYVEKDIMDHYINLARDYYKDLDESLSYKSSPLKESDDDSKSYFVASTLNKYREEIKDFFEDNILDWYDAMDNYDGSFDDYEDRGEAIEEYSKRETENIPLDELIDMLYNYLEEGDLDSSEEMMAQKYIDILKDLEELGVSTLGDFS